MNDLEKQIHDLRLEVVNKEKYERRLQEAQTKYNSLLREKELLEKQLIKEKKDVKRLESISLTSLWFSLIGRKEEKLEQEKKEYTEVEYKYKNLCNTISYLEEDINVYKERLDIIREQEIELSKLLEQKEIKIIEENNEDSIKLRELNKDIFLLEKGIKELNEAINEGDKLLEGLDKAHGTIKKARGWSTWDLLGGGIFADMMKYSHVRNVNNQIETLKVQCRKFIEELKDVNISLRLNIRIEDTLKFFDFFFDGIFVDYEARKRIVKAEKAIKNQMYEIRIVLQDLKNKLKENNKNLNNLLIQKEQFLLGDKNA